jgi:ribosome-binding factor A
VALSHRIERIAEQVREEVSQILSTEVADPGVGLVTVTRVKVTADLSLARIYWTTMGDAKQRKETTKALARAAGFVRHLLSERLTLRRSPELQFLYDHSVAAQDRVEQILHELKQEEDARKKSEE